MEKLKQLQWLIIAVLAFSAFGTVFYWSMWRPTQIRKQCYTWALKKVDVPEISGRQKLEAYDIAYNLCVKEFGLE